MSVVPVPPYEPNPKHRDNSPNKSQWTISVPEERSCFALAHANGWVVVGAVVGWGLLLDAADQVRMLGVSDDGDRDLWWAKFVGKTAPWHGYPADLRRRQEADIPPITIRREWFKRDYISKPALAKLGRKQPCKPK